MDIRKFRKANNISQKDLADFSGVTQGAVSQWESGLTNIPSSIFQKIMLNDKGWDTSTLLEGFRSPTSSNVTKISGVTNSPTTVNNNNNNNNGGFEDLARMIEELKEQNKTQREQISSLTEIIKNLTAR